MKNGNNCPKCGGKDIRVIPGKLPLTEHHNFTKVTVWKNIMIERYLCIYCGFTEEWVEKDEDLDLLRKKAKQRDDFSNFV